MLLSALHVTVAGRSTGFVVVTPTPQAERVRQKLASVNFADLPPGDQYQTLLTDLFFDDRGVQLLKLEDIEIR